MRTNTLSAKQKDAKPIQAVYILILSIVLTALCSWSYGASYVLYVLTSVVLVVYAYWGFFKKSATHCTVIELMLWLCLLINLFVMLMVGELKSVVMVNASLLLPFAIACTDIDISYMRRDGFIASLVAMAIAFLLHFWAKEQNVNSQAILMYVCMTVSYIWLLHARSAMDIGACIVYLLVMLWLIFATGSRNTVIVSLVCFALVLLCRFIEVPRWFFRCLYITAMLVTVFAIPLMSFVFDNEAILRPLEEFTTRFSDKPWGMDSHLVLLQWVKRSFDADPLLVQLFGNAMLIGNRHNLFYQCLSFYGYVGTVGIYIFYGYIFETGYALYKKCHDTLSLSCCLMLIGFFFLQCAEVFMLGLETASMIGALPAGLILYQQRVAFQDGKLVRRKRVWSLNA